MKLTLRIWRQKDTDTAGRFVAYPVDNVSGDMSFLEMLDVLNEELTNRGEAPPIRRPIATHIPMSRLAASGAALRASGQTRRDGRCR